MAENNFTLEELENLEEVKIEVDKNPFEVNSGICKRCKEKMVKIVENRNVLDGTITFHIIKLKCEKCGKEYLDLDQAEKYDFLITLEKAMKQPLEMVSKRIAIA